MPNGGIPVDDYIYDNGTFGGLLKINNSLIYLLQNGIIKMNNKYYFDCLNNSFTSLKYLSYGLNK